MQIYYLGLNYVMETRLRQLNGNIFSDRPSLTQPALIWVFFVAPILCDSQLLYTIVIFPLFFSGSSRGENSISPTFVWGYNT